MALEETEKKIYEKPCDVLSSIEFNVFVSSIKENLEYLILKTNLRRETEGVQTDVFNSRHVPTISLEDYLKRIVKYSQVEQSTLIISFIYVERLCSLNLLALTKLNVHRIIFLSIYVSVKYNEDSHYKLDYFSEIAGISPQEITRMELEFLELLHFKLFVCEDTFNSFSKLLERK